MSGLLERFVVFLSKAHLVDSLDNAHGNSAEKVSNSEDVPRSKEPTSIQGSE